MSVAKMMVTVAFLLCFISLAQSSDTLRGPNVCLRNLRTNREMHKAEGLSKSKWVEVCCKGFSKSPKNTCLPICTQPCPRGTACVGPEKCSIPHKEKCGFLHKGHTCVKEASRCERGTLKEGSFLCQGAVCCLPHKGRKVKRAARLAPGAKSAEKCEEYKKYVFEEEESPVPLAGESSILMDKCGRVSQTLVIGGENADEREFPHMALIGYEVNRTLLWLCGGSLISEQFILSAAHCAEPERLGRARAKWALLGDLIVNSNEDEFQSKPVQVEIGQHFLHPKYNPERVYHDIVLFKLKRPVILSPYVRPICLHTDSGVPKTSALATGWGITNITTKAVKQHLQKVSLNFNDYETCKDSYKPTNRFPTGINSQIQLCAGNTGKDTCKGDSGGPLQINLEKPYCMQAIVGVTSFGKKYCGSGVPAVYTKVSYYIPWIEPIVWP